MSIDLEIRALLLSPQLKEISFSMRGIRVTGPGFAELANCFSDHPIRHRIRVTTRPVLVGPRSIAVYMPDTNKILLRSDTVLHTVIGRSHVVHELTHAQLDLRGRSTPLRSDESAAFIAEAWYLLASGVSNDEIDQSVTSGIRTIAADLRNQAQISRGVVEVSADQINTARWIMGTFRYENGHYHYDGIRGRIYRETTRL